MPDLDPDHPVRSWVLDQIDEQTPQLNVLLAGTELHGVDRNLVRYPNTETGPS